MNDTNHIHRLTMGNKALTLIGTAHVSRISTQLVREVIEEELPDIVAVELCEARYRSLIQTDAERIQNAVPFFQQKESLSSLIQRVLGFVQRRIGRRLDVNPGEEMLQAIRSARRVGARLCLADRDVSTTLFRVWSGMRRLTKFKLSLQLLAALVQADRIKPEEVEAMKNDTALEKSLAQIERSYPEISRVVIDERDQYLAYQLRRAAGQHIVAVVGAGHVPGIRRYLHWDLRELAAAVGEPAEAICLQRAACLEDALSNL